MHNAVPLRTRAVRRLLPLVLLSAIPLTALAALSTFDLSGATRASPVTMGALEVGTTVSPLAAPTNLRVALR